MNKLVFHRIKKLSLAKWEDSLHHLEWHASNPRLQLAGFIAWFMGEGKGYCAFCHTWIGDTYKNRCHYYHEISCPILSVGCSCAYEWDALLELIALAGWSISTKEIIRQAPTYPTYYLKNLKKMSPEKIQELHQTTIFLVLSLMGKIYTARCPKE